MIILQIINVKQRKITNIAQITQEQMTGVLFASLYLFLHITLPVFLIFFKHLDLQTTFIYTSNFHVSQTL